MKLTQEHVNALADYIRDNATVRVSEKSGNDYIGIDGFEHEFAGIRGTVKFSAYGFREIAEARQRLTKRVATDIAKLTPEEKADLLEALTK